ncbi:MAG TPA: right-handed parallel beta-helix repeat-containing protein, partial [Polyangia bacterium]
MLKLRSIFVTSLLTGLVVTSNFGCGGGGTSTDVAIDKPTDTKTDVTPDVPKDTGGTGGATTDAKDALDAVDAIDVPKDTVDATDATDVPKDATDAGEVSDAGDAKDATDASDAEVTTPVCTSPCTIGAHQCGTGGGVQTCATNASGCAVFGAEVACGTHQACSAGVCGCVAPTDTGCTAAGAFCGSDGSLKTCALDGSCKFVSASAACAGNQTCTGTTPGSGACTCNNACALGTGVTTATICSADNSSTETCSKDTNGCNVISAVVACPGVQTCVGAACVCPAVATTPAVGLGCAGANTPNACAGDSVLECSQDQASQCYVWHVKIDCTQADSTLTPPRPAGLTCGKGTSGTGAAACQCNANATHTVFVDPVSGSDSLNTSFFPTGVSDPPACRFKSLRQGLGTAGVTTVHGVHEGANVTPVVFSFDTTFPLVVPDGVTLMSDDNTPADYIISVTSGGIGIQLGKNSMVQGFEVRTDGLTNIATSINGTGATLDTVNIVKGSSTPTTGVSISGATLNPTLNSVTVNGAAGAGIDVLASSVTITGTSSVSNSGTGIHISEGTVDATGFVANLNGTGVKVESSTTAVFKAHGGTFSNSTGVGISVATGKFFADQGATIKDNTGDGVDGTSGAQVDLSGAVVTGNAFGVFSSGNGSVTIEGGSDISSNHSDGVVGGDSTLAISGGTTINKNGGNGVKLNGATTTISGVTVDGNTFNGIDVNSPGGVSIVIGKAGSGTFLTNNTLAGLLIEKTLQTVN